MVSINMVLGAKERMNDRNAAAQENAARAAAQGQVDSARAQGQFGVLDTIWRNPNEFGNILGGVYGTQAGNVGQPGSNYSDIYGNMTAGMASLGGNASQNYGAYAQGLSGLAQNYGQLSNANAMAEAARQGTLGNIASGALGAWGGALNAAMGAYGLQQQAYNLAMGEAMKANQGAVSSLGQSRNNALANIGNAYGAVSGAAAQLGAAGLGASQYNMTDSVQEQYARNRQETGGTGESFARDNATMYGGDAGYGGGSGGFQATGPSGTIASGSYGGGGAGGGYNTQGSRNATSGLTQSTYGINDSSASQIARQSQRQGPQMDAFLAALGAGAAGIDGSFRGLADTRNQAMDNSYLSNLNSSYNSGIGQLRSDNRTALAVPGQMLDQGLAGLLRLGGQGYNNSRRGMDQYYQSTAQQAPGAIAGLLTGGYLDSANRLGGIQNSMISGANAANQNVRNTQDMIRQDGGTARNDLLGIYGDSTGRWMGGDFYTGPGAMSGLMPEFRDPTNLNPQQYPYGVRPRRPVQPGVPRGSRDMPAPTTWQQEGDARLAALYAAMGNR